MDGAWSEQMDKQQSPQELDAVLALLSSEAGRRVMEEWHRQAPDTGDDEDRVWIAGRQGVARVARGAYQRWMASAPD